MVELTNGIPRFSHKVRDMKNGASQSDCVQFETIERTLYDKILDFYNNSRDPEQIDIWKGLEYTKLMELLKGDPDTFYTLIRNSILLILGLFSDRMGDLYGKGIEELSPDEQDEIFDDIRAICVEN